MLYEGPRPWVRFPVSFYSTKVFTKKFLVLFYMPKTLPWLEVILFHKRDHAFLGQLMICIGQQLGFVGTKGCQSENPVPWTIAHLTELSNPLQPAITKVRTERTKVLQENLPRPLSYCQQSRTSRYAGMLQACSESAFMLAVCCSSRADSNKSEIDKSTGQQVWTAVMRTWLIQVDAALLWIY